MTRMSILRIAAFCSLALATIIFASFSRHGGGAAGTAFAFTPPVSGFYGAIDCDTATAGVQDGTGGTCRYINTPGAVDVAVMFADASSLGLDISSFNFDVLGDAQTRLTPAGPAVTSAAPAFNGNPDFDEAGFIGSAGIWQCTPPSVVADADPSATATDSFISCYTTVTGPVVDSTLHTLTIVHYLIPAGASDGVVNLSIVNLGVGDQDGSILLVCNDLSTPENNTGPCFGATVTLYTPASPTPTSTPTATNTPVTPTVTNTPTITPTFSVPDSDGDGLNDQEELLLGTNPHNADTDGDGLGDGVEAHTTHTNPLMADTDGDGLNDGTEVNTTGTNPLIADSDGDGLGDGTEVNVTHTNPNNTDSDGDGLHDAAEVNTFHTNPNAADTDGDGLDDLQEVVVGTNPTDPDTDHDGLTDGQEVLTYLSSPFLQDTDGDLLPDAQEVNVTHTNPRVADTDHDGLSDGYEVNVSSTNPNVADTDGDGVGDGVEVNTYHSNPHLPDTDGDTMPDGFEVLHSCLNVLVNDAAADPDLDFVGNLAELAQFTNPCNRDTDGDGFNDLTSISHAYINTNPFVDNCIVIPNPGQLNTDGEFYDLPPTILYDDLTNPRSDALGDPCDPDADNDGILNTTETAGPPCPSASGATNPLKLDTDGDGTIDSAECLLGTDPVNPLSVPPRSPAADTDHDGLADLTEIILGTNPLLPDTDGDGLIDGAEVKYYGSNPLVADTDSDGCDDGKEAASINADRAVTSTDLQQVAAHFGPAGPTYIRGLDPNRDGTINATDLNLVAKKFGPC